MSIVAGIDFGTQSVRISIVDRDRGQLGVGVSAYPLLRRSDDIHYAAQRHADHLHALEQGMQAALASAKISGDAIGALAIDTTGSTVVPVGENLEPLDDYYLWCDHRAWREAAELTRMAKERDSKNLDWSGGTYLSEFGFSKLLHWLRNNPELRSRFVTALEHCDMITAVLCGIDDPREVPRSVCAAGHKWLWNATLGGFPDNDYFTAVDPLLAGIGEKITGRFEKSDQIAGTLCEAWAKRLGLRTGIPIPFPSLDAHWDAIGAGITLGSVVNVIGTSTCVMALSQNPVAIPGVCGVVDGSIHPRWVGIEAGLSAAGDLFDGIAMRSGVSTSELFGRIANYRSGQSRLIRIPWDNGDRTILGNPLLSGVTIGWNLLHKPEDELFAAIEGTAFQTRMIFERMEEYGVPIESVINAGGIPRRSPLINQIYANALNRPIRIAKGDSTGLGSAIFAFLALGDFASVEEAQTALCPEVETIDPEPAGTKISQELFEHFRGLYLTFGDGKPLQHTLAETMVVLQR